MKQLKIILLFSLILRIIIIFCSPVKTDYKKYQNIEGTIRNIKQGSTVSITIYNSNVLIKTKEKITYKIGDKISVSCKMEYPSSNSNFHLFNYKNYLMSSRIFLICNGNNLKLVKKNNNILYEFKNLIYNRIEKNKASTYLKLFILGENELENNIKKSYMQNGIMHLFANSGRS